MIRMTDAEICEFDALYSSEYQLYNVISTVVEDYEGVKGGLRAPEVWREVLEIEKRLAAANRPDRFVALERTRLAKEYKRFCYKGADGKLYLEGKEERSGREVERSVNCVLLALGMRLGSYPEDMRNPYEIIMERIRQMLLQSEDLQLLAKLTNEYYDSEDVEEELGNIVPEEDVLKPHVKPKVKKELVPLYEFLKPIMNYYALVLVNEAGLGYGVTEQTFYDIWNDLLLSEPILRELSIPNKNLENTLADDDLKPEDSDYEVKGNDYNLKLVMALIGVMIEKKIVNNTISGTRKLFFNDNKDRYFSPNKYMQFGSSESGFPTKAMYETVLKIIKDHKKG